MEGSELRLRVALCALSVLTLLLAVDRAIASWPPSPIQHGNGNPNTFVGGNSSETYYGEGGNDIIKMRDGGDVAYGGPDDDVVEGESGYDWLYGGSGADRVETGSGSGNAHGDAGDDIMLGGGGRDDLLGDAGSDKLVGAGDDDTLYGGPGPDEIDGGAGDDFLTDDWQPGWPYGTPNTYDGGPGDDICRVATIDTWQGCERWMFGFIDRPNCKGDEPQACENRLEPFKIAEISTEVTSAEFSHKFDHTVPPGKVVGYELFRDCDDYELCIKDTTTATIYVNPEQEVFERRVLERFVPRLVYDDDEAFEAGSVELATNRWTGAHGLSLEGTNRLQRDAVGDIESNDGLEVPQFGLETLTDFVYPSSGSEPSIAVSTSDTIDMGDDDSEEALSSDSVALANYNAERYANKTYARYVTSGGVTWLQYWFFYVYNPSPPGSFGFGKHEGDWEGVQVRLLGTSLAGLSEEPTSVAASAHSGGTTCAWNDVQVIGNTPTVYVAVNSHASYLKTGRFGFPGFADDAVDGDGEVRVPDVEKISSGDDWVRWPGRWGDSPGDDPFPSPVSPREQGDKWTNPETWASGLDDGECDERRRRHIPSETDVPSVEIATARSQERRIQISYQLKRPHDELPSSVGFVVRREGRAGGILKFQKVESIDDLGGSVSLPVPPGRGSLEIHSSAYGADGARREGETLTVKLEPD